MRSSLSVAALCGCLCVSGCLADEPDRLSTREVPVEVDTAQDLTLEHSGSTMWAEVDAAADVRCDAWPAGAPGERAELTPHYLDLQSPQPVERGGVDYQTVGRFPMSSGDVVVECTGPAGARLYASLTRRPA